jgi:hypothetical protein
VPIELISYEGAGITIGDHTFINYGSSPETFLLIVWRRAIRLASSAASNLATLVHRRSSLPVPLAPLVREWGCRVGGSRPRGGIRQPASEDGLQSRQKSLNRFGASIV